MSEPANVPALTTFTSGDLVISVYGDGDGSGTYTDNQASPIVLEELSTTGVAVGQMTLPEVTTTLAGSGIVENAISGEYGSSSEGTIELAGNGQSLVIAGYGVNDVTFNTGGATVYGNAAEAQSISVPDGKSTPVARVIADISANGTVDTSTALFNVFNTNNPRSVATENGSTFYIAGQGVKGDKTQGVFTALDGASSATAIDNSTDARTVEISNGKLFVSRDSKQGAGGGTSNISNFGTTLPTSATTPAVLPGISQTVTLTAAQENSANAGAVGTNVNLSPENFFFANATTLYVADGGIPKAGGVGDGGLQKWTFDGTKWNLQYTLSAGLNLVSNSSASGTTGLIGLTGVVNNDGTVSLYATNSTIGDLDPTFLYSISDELNATAAAPGEQFTTLMAAAPDTNIRGVAFAPSAAPAPTNTVVSSGSTQSGTVVGSGSTLTVQAGGTIVNASIQNGGSATILGTDSGSFIAQGGFETVSGSVSGDTIFGTQFVSVGTAIVSNESVASGGNIDLFLKGITASDITVGSGGTLNISGNLITTDIVIDGGSVMLQSPKPTISGSVIFEGPGTITDTVVASAGTGILAVISGFAIGDVIDEAGIGAGATLATSVVSGNTVETITSGGVSQALTFAGTYAPGFFELVNSGGTELTVNGAPMPMTTVISSGATQSDVIVTSAHPLSVLAGGTVISATIDNGGVATVSGVDSGSVILAGGNETVLGSATGDQVFGTQLVSAATAVVSNETVFNGGVVDLFLKGAVANNLTLSSGATISINGNATAENTVINGGTIILGSPKAVLGTAVTFAGAGLIEIAAVISAGFGDLAVISGFATGDAIEENAMGTGTTLNGVTSGGNTIETITSGSVSDSFIFAGTYAPDYFRLVSGPTSAEITAPCYCTGTRILAVGGEIPVEDIRIGDLLVTVREGGPATGKVVWTGRRSIDISRHPDPDMVRPIRIAASAFAPGVPERDLRVSPHHAIYVDGNLFEAAALLNGVTIFQETATTHVTYHHVELESHDILLAEGLAAESFLDTGNRKMFENEGVTALHPHFRAPSNATFCAPLILDGVALDALRQKLGARAMAFAAAA